MRVHLNSEGNYPTKLNLGCGRDLKKDYLNLDISFGDCRWEEAKMSDYSLAEGRISSPDDLPFNHFTRIRANMVLEHVHPDLLHTFIYHLRQSMVTGGALVAVVPYLIGTVAGFSEDSEDHLEELRRITYYLLSPQLGDTSNQHLSCWTVQYARYLFLSEQFASVDVEISESWRELIITAIK